MVIDIDGFLEGLDSESKNDAPEKIKTISLDFQKDVEDLLDKKIVEGKNQELNILEKIYDELKSFDKDLPNKFLGIEKKGDLAIKQIGDIYSHTFLQNLENYTKSIENRIIQNVEKISSLIVEGEISQAIKLFNQTNKLCSLFPKYYIEKKFELISKVRELEKTFFISLEKLKNEKEKEVKNNLSLALRNLKEKYNSNDISIFEDSYNNLLNLYLGIPKVLLTQLQPEKIEIISILKKSQEKLLTLYKSDFNLKESSINNLMEKFHSNFIKKDLESCLIYYNDILLIFKDLPDVLLEKKLGIHKKINELYVSLNDLVINNHVSTFLRTYETSKSLENIKKIISHLKFSITDKSILVEVEQKIKDLPKELDDEKKSLLLELDEIKSNEKISNLNTSNSAKNENKFKIEDVKDPISNSKIDLLKYANTHHKKSILKEIELYYNKLKSNNNLEVLQSSYKKILFYLDVLKVNNDEKQSIISKLNKIISIKKIEK